jgi:hypothetical protein
MRDADRKRVGACKMEKGMENFRVQNDELDSACSQEAPHEAEISCRNPEPKFFYLLYPLFRVPQKRD